MKPWPAALTTMLLAMALGGCVVPNSKSDGGDDRCAVVFAVWSKVDCPPAGAVGR